MSSASSVERYGIGSISVSPVLRNFVEKRLLPGTGVTTHDFWWGLDSIVKDLMPTNTSLLHKREALQRQVDEWHRWNPAPYRADKYEDFLYEIGYLEADIETPFKIETQDVDAEIATVAGPQLVCPVDNGRFILNAANARWGSLLDALYATNAVALPGSPDGPYDAMRGRAVFRAAHRLLDEFFPLRLGSWDEVSSLRIVDGTLLAGLAPEGNTHWGADAHIEVGLRDTADFVAHGSAPRRPYDADNLSIVLRKHGLHLELLVDPHGGHRGHRAGIVDVKLESALSTICDFEDSACTVDARDKVGAYANWLGLMDRSLSVEVEKKGARVERSLNQTRRLSTPDGCGTVELPGQALLLARNVGMHMYTDMVTTTHGEQPIPEHFVDALVTAAAALHDVRRHQANSRHGSIYIVKPKMHGPEEAALAATLMARVEGVLGLPTNTIKIGVMDEERRTSANLLQTMRAVAGRLFFVNTGFLDRTADEIHTAMEAGPVLPKEAIKSAPWYAAYEQGNVASALLAQLVGRGQIGKGMWAEPDDMASMLALKGQQLDAGASTAWVPSPVAATLHSLHYLRQSVCDVQEAMATQQPSAAEAHARRRALLTPPLLGSTPLSAEAVQAELDNNAQGLLGYVVRWVGAGVGCSKVPNLQAVQLMEDRATLRISSQHIANWLHHGVVTETQVMQTLRRVAGVVDEQNSADPKYTPMAPTFDGPEWHAAVDLIFHGRVTPNGYTEATLSHWRKVRKAAGATPSAKAKPLSGRSPSWSDEEVYRRGSSMGGAM